MKWIEILRKGNHALLQSESDAEYVVASGYDPTQPENEQWDHGMYFTYWNNTERKPAALQEALDFFRSRTEDCHFVDKGEKYLEIYRSDYMKGTFMEMLNCLNLSDDQVDEAFGIWCRVDEGSLNKREDE